MDYIEWFYGRLTELRIQKGVSARDMSLSLGQSESYINKIENKRTLTVFVLKPTPQGFFGLGREKDCSFFPAFGFLRPQIDTLAGKLQV